MKILLCLLKYGYVRNFEPVIRELAARGHAIHIGAERHDRDEAARLVIEALARECPSVTFGPLPERESGHAKTVLAKIRLGFDYLRYLEPAYTGMSALRMRSEERVAVGLLHLLDLPGMRRLPGRRLVRTTLQQLEWAAPPSPAVEEYLRATRPDVVLITPLIGVVASSQLDYLAATRRLGIPTGFCVWSWDNLSTKGLIRHQPDAVFVWNETQKEEAVRLHRVPPDHVVVTGAQCFDRWFGRAPTRSREEFCASVGLPANRPYVLYVGSTMVGRTAPESEFIVRWIRHLRSSADRALREAAILVRPHPARIGEWEGIDLRQFELVALSTSNPIDERARADYFDALYHSAAVVGINTSAFIEATIIGKPVYAILTPEFSGTQQWTIHFRYLTEVGGGAVQTGRGVEEHAAQLADALRGSRAHDARNRRFIEAFVRPRGIDSPATPVFVEAVEALGGKKVDTASALAPRWPLAAWAFRRLTEATASGRWKRLLLTRGEFEALAAREAAKSSKRPRALTE